MGSDTPSNSTVIHPSSSGNVDKNQGMYQIVNGKENEHPDA